ncbi:GAF domain-containing protein [Salinithrix halophila]|uniref:GAF domain-containing protein n=1 Tax=Salinithrix halophila TaxID=1485204 RepID=A0ABV8JF49_9BACL
MLPFKQVEGNKEAQYSLLLNQAKSLFVQERDWLANLANGASLLYHSLDQINWAGFYLMRDGELVLGPFMGMPACIRIPIGKGVCGTAVKEDSTQVVTDVLQFPGHIACDATTRSEIVIPIRMDGEIVGVLDMDSPVTERFDATDKKHLETFVQIFLDNTDWPSLSR